MTSDDVKYSLQRAANPKVAAAQYTGMASWFSGVETPDKYTAIFKSELPRPTIFDLLEFLNIADKDTLEGPDAKNTANRHRPVQVRRVGARRPCHAGAQPELLAVWQAVPGRHQRLHLARPAGDGDAARSRAAIDVARLPTLTDFNRLKTDPKYQAMLNTQTGAHYLAG